MTDLALELRPDLDRGPGHALLAVSGLGGFSAASGVLFFLLRRPAYSKGVLGPSGWQVAEHRWQVDVDRRGSSVLELAIGPEIAAHMAAGNYVLEMQGDDGESLGEGVLVWKDVVAAVQVSIDGRPARRRVWGVGLQAAAVTTQDGSSDAESSTTESADDDQSNGDDDDSKTNAGGKRRRGLMAALASVGLASAMTAGWMLWPEETADSLDSELAVVEADDPEPGENPPGDGVEREAVDRDAVVWAKDLLRRDASEPELLAAARQLLDKDRVAEAGAVYRQVTLRHQSAEAMRSMGELYDPRSLADDRRGQLSQAVPRHAVRWYRDAVTQGDTEAEVHLQALEEWVQQNPEDALAEQTRTALGMDIVVDTDMNAGMDEAADSAVDSVVDSAVDSVVDSVQSNVEEPGEP